MSAKYNPIVRLASRMSKIVSLVCLFISFETSAEVFYVSLVRGNVTKAGVPLKTGDVLEDNNSEFGI